MSFRGTRAIDDETNVQALTSDWGPRESVVLYLDRCQVDTPSTVVQLTWAQVLARRAEINKVIDFGAGDGRFAKVGRYRRYIGYEIDVSRSAAGRLPRNARMVNKCAFSELINDADLCIGNPPYVRNQDLPVGWRERAAKILLERTTVKVSGLANAWLYFFLLSLISTKGDGLVALVVPYEWVSRPSSKALRHYIREKRWNVSVYRLLDDTFSRVLTTSSITIIDKRTTKGMWEYFEQTARGTFKRLPSASGSKHDVIEYAGGYRGSARPTISARRGLSPGTQEVLTLTEGERVRYGLRVSTDVVPCVTSLRSLAESCPSLTVTAFKKNFVLAGKKCWLIRTDRKISSSLKAYLDSVPKEKRKTATCLDRKLWWKFTMPEVPSLLIATGFRGKVPKLVANKAGTRAVGGVCGIYGVVSRKRQQLVAKLRNLDVSQSVVAHSNGLRKLEINQLNTLINQLTTEKK